MPAEIRITSEMLYKGMLVFALMDALFVPLLAWRVSAGSFHRLKWPLVIAAALVWYAIWSWAIRNFWDTVYSYVFPPWAQTWVPWIALIAAGAVAFGLQALALRLNRHVVLTFCLMGGLLGSLTHIWAVQRGIVTRPPMLQGASPLAAIIFAFFEYLLYWCTILLIASGMDWLYRRLARLAS